MNVDLIKSYIATYKSHALRRLKKDYPQLVSELLTQFETDDIKLAVACLLSGKNSSFCEFKQKFKIKSMESIRFCANDCKCALISAKEKREKLYNILTQEEKRQIVEKRKLVFLEKYGVDNPAKSKEIYAKIKNTNIKKYGDESHLSSDKIRTKIKDTCLEKYGVDNPAKSEFVQRKFKNTCLEKYGVDNPRKIKGMSERIEQTNIQKRGVPHNHQECWPARTYDILNDTEKFKEFVLDKYVEDIIQDLEISPSTFYKKINEHGLKGSYLKKDSVFEREVRQFIEEILDTEILYNVRTIIPPSELDIFIKEKNIAIECNGNFWHSQHYGNKSKSYHVSKTNLCEKNNIRLLHILYSEWKHSNDIVKSIIRNSLGLTKDKIPARKTNITKISKQVAKDFLNKNHIQGSIPASIHLGLFYNNELVSLLSIGKSRKALGSSHTEGVFEIYRFCNKLDTSVIGSFSKLLKFFEKEYSPKKIITYADRRYFVGNMYQTNGFKLTKVTSPNYWYFDIKNPDKLFHRYNFTKHSLLKEGFDHSLTEWEIMRLKKFDRIWDCGNLRFEKSYE